MIMNYSLATHQNTRCLRQASMSIVEFRLSMTIEYGEMKNRKLKIEDSFAT